MPENYTAHPGAADLSSIRSVVGVELSKTQLCPVSRWSGRDNCAARRHAPQKHGPIRPKRRAGHRRTHTRARACERAGIGPAMFIARIKVE